MKRKHVMVLSALCFALAMTGCGKSGSDSTADASNPSGELEYDVNREDMEGLETSEEESETAKSTSSEEETTEEETSEPATDENGEPVSENSSGSSDSSSGNKNDRGNSGGTTEEEYYRDDDAPSEIFYPDVEIFGDKNIDNNVALYNVNVNGKVLDLRHETVDTFINQANIRQNESVLHFNEMYDTKDGEDVYDGIFYYAKGYGAYSNTQDESKRFTGTHVFIEGLRDDLLSVEVDPYAENAYSIRGLYASIGMTKDFDVLFAGGVKCGMKRSEVEDILGKGDKSKGYTYYANDNNVLMIRYSDDKAVEIYLFNDYAFLPIQYSGKEYDDSDTDETTDSREVEDTTSAKDTSKDIPIEDDDYDFSNKPVPDGAETKKN